MASSVISVEMPRSASEAAENQNSKVQQGGGDLDKRTPMVSGRAGRAGLPPIGPHDDTDSSESRKLSPIHPLSPPGGTAESSPRAMSESHSRRRSESDSGMRLGDETNPFSSYVSDSSGSGPARKLDLDEERGGAALSPMHPASKTPGPPRRPHRSEQPSQASHDASLWHDQQQTGNASQTREGADQSQSQLDPMLHGSDAAARADASSGTEVQVPTRTDVIGGSPLGFKMLADDSGSDVFSPLRGSRPGDTGTGARAGAGAGAGAGVSDKDVRTQQQQKQQLQSYSGRETEASPWMVTSLGDANGGGIGVGDSAQELESKHLSGTHQSPLHSLNSRAVTPAKALPTGVHVGDNTQPSDAAAATQLTTESLSIRGIAPVESPSSSSSGSDATHQNQGVDIGQGKGAGRPASGAGRTSGMIESSEDGRVLRPGKDDMLASSGTGTETGSTNEAEHTNDSGLRQAPVVRSLSRDDASASVDRDRRTIPTPPISRTHSPRSAQSSMDRDQSIHVPAPPSLPKSIESVNQSPSPSHSRLGHSRAHSHSPRLASNSPHPAGAESVSGSRKGGGLGGQGQQLESGSRRRRSSRRSRGEHSIGDLDDRALPSVQRGSGALQAQLELARGDLAEALQARNQAQEERNRLSANLAKLASIVSSADGDFREQASAWDTQKRQLEAKLADAVSNLAESQARQDDAVSEAARLRRETAAQVQEAASSVKQSLGLKAKAESAAEAAQQQAVAAISEAESRAAESDAARSAAETALADCRAQLSQARAEQESAMQTAAARETNLAGQLAEMNGSQAKLREDLKQALHASAAYEQQLAAAMSGVSATKSDLVAAQQAAAKAKTSEQMAQDALRGTEARAGRLEQQLQERTAREERLRVRVQQSDKAKASAVAAQAAAEARIKGLEDMLAQEQGVAQALNSKLLQAEARGDAAREKLELERDSADRARESQREAETAQQGLERALEEATARCSEAAEESERKKSEIESARQEIDGLRAQVEAERAAEDEVRARLATAEAAARAASETASAAASLAKGEQEQLRGQLEALQLQLAEAQAKPAPVRLPESLSRDGWTPATYTGKRTELQLDRGAVSPAAVQPRPALSLSPAENKSKPKPKPKPSSEDGMPQTMDATTRLLATALRASEDARAKQDAKLRSVILELEGFKSKTAGASPPRGSSETGLQSQRQKAGADGHDLPDDASAISATQSMPLPAALGRLKELQAAIDKLQRDRQRLVSSARKQGEIVTELRARLEAGHQARHDSDEDEDKDGETVRLRSIVSAKDTELQRLRQTVQHLDRRTADAERGRITCERKLAESEQEITELVDALRTTKQAADDQERKARVHALAASESKTSLDLTTAQARDLEEEVGRLTGELQQALAAIETARVRETRRAAAAQRRFGSVVQSLEALKSASPRKSAAAHPASSPSPSQLHDSVEMAGARNYASAAAGTAQQLIVQLSPVRAGGETRRSAKPVADEDDIDDDTGYQVVDEVDRSVGAALDSAAAAAASEAREEVARLSLVLREVRAERDTAREALGRLSGDRATAQEKAANATRRAVHAEQRTEDLSAQGEKSRAKADALEQQATESKQLLRAIGEQLRQRLLQVASLRKQSDLFADQLKAERSRTSQLETRLLEGHGRLHDDLGDRVRRIRAEMDAARAQMDDTVQAAVRTKQLAWEAERQDAEARHRAELFDLQRAATKESDRARGLERRATRVQGDLAAAERRIDVLLAGARAVCGLLLQPLERVASGSNQHRPGNADSVTSGEDSLEDGMDVRSRALAVSQRAHAEMQQEVLRLQTRLMDAKLQPDSDRQSQLVSKANDESAGTERTERAVGAELDEHLTELVNLWRKRAQQAQSLSKDALLQLGAAKDEAARFAATVLLAHDRLQKLLREQTDKASVEMLRKNGNGDSGGSNGRGDYDTGDSDGKGRGTAGSRMHGGGGGAVKPEKRGSTAGAGPAGPTGMATSSAMQCVAIQERSSMASTASTLVAVHSLESAEVAGKRKHAAPETMSNVSLMLDTTNPAEDAAEPLSTRQGASRIFPGEARSQNLSKDGAIAADGVLDQEEAHQANLSPNGSDLPGMANRRESPEIAAGLPPSPAPQYPTPVKLKTAIAGSASAGSCDFEASVPPRILPSWPSTYEPAAIAEGSTDGSSAGMSSPKDLAKSPDARRPSTSQVFRASERSALQGRGSTSELVETGASKPEEMPEGPAPVIAHESPLSLESLHSVQSPGDESCSDGAAGNGHDSISSDGIVGARQQSPRGEAPLRMETPMDESDYLTSPLTPVVDVEMVVSTEGVSRPETVPSTRSIPEEGVTAEIRQRARSIPLSSLVRRIREETSTPDSMQRMQSSIGFHLSGGAGPALENDGTRLSRPSAIRDEGPVARRAAAEVRDIVDRRLAGDQRRSVSKPQPQSQSNAKKTGWVDNSGSDHTQHRNISSDDVCMPIPTPDLGAVPVLSRTLERNQRGRHSVPNGRANSAEESVVRSSPRRRTARRDILATARASTTGASVVSTPPPGL